MSPSKDKILVIHADDFGIHPAVNQAILAGHRSGRVQSASLLANGEAFEQALAMARDNPELDVGAHLTLIQGRPISDHFPAFPQETSGFLWSYFRSSPSPAAVRREWQAQIEKIISGGIRLSHIDSHKHVHLIPGLFTVALDLARRYDIPFIRIPRPCYWDLTQMPPQIRTFLLGGLSLYAPKLKHSAARAQIQCVDRSLGFLDGGRMSLASLVRSLRTLPPGITELIVHPGSGDPSCQRFYSGGFRNATDLEILQHPGLAQSLSALQIKLLNFRQLARRPFSAPLPA